MHNLVVELRETPKNVSLSLELAKDIASKSANGKIIIVTAAPASLLASVKKQWHNLINRLEKERASTLVSIQIQRLQNEMTRLKQATFSSEYESFEPKATVTFATVDELVNMPPVCRTIYITHEIERAKLHLLTSWMPYKSLVVLYED